ncbi:MAG: hypothetical protein ACFFB5_15785 [Promethearchaeota archaeon]
MLTNDRKKTQPGYFDDPFPEETKTIELLDYLILPHTMYLSGKWRKWVNNPTLIKEIVSTEFTSSYAIIREFIRKGEANDYNDVISSKIDNSFVNMRIFKHRYTQYMFHQKHLIETLKYGEQGRKHGNFKDFLLFSQKWNEIVKEKIAPTSHMWYLYNEIQQIYGAPLRRFRYNSDEFERLKVFQDFEIDLGTSCFTPGFYEEWFILRNKIVGKKCLIDLNIVNPSTGLRETYYIRNAKSTWNKNGIKPFLFAKKTGARRKIMDYLMETINPYKPKLSSIRITLMDEIIAELKAMDIGYPEESWQARNGFKKVYRPKFDELLLDDYLEIKFWEYIDDLKPNWLSRYKNVQKIVKSFEDKGRRVIFITDELYYPNICNSTKIYLQDRSKLIDAITKEINNQNKFPSDRTDFNKWWNKVRTKITPMHLARAIQKIRKQSKHLHYSGIIYSIDQAEKFPNIGPINRNLKEFLDENNPKGLPAFVGAVIQDPKIRLRITLFTQERNQLGNLDLPLKVVSEIKWGYIKTHKNLITFPDNITRANQKACEIVQTKFIRELGNKKGKLRDSTFLFDELKTLGNYDLTSGKVKNLQVEFIPKGSVSNCFINEQKDFNILILSYWGESDYKLGRLMEVTSAIRHGLFKRNIKNSDILVTHVTEILNKYGEEAIGFKRELDNNTRTKINELISILNFNAGEETLFRDIYLYTLWKHSKRGYY